MQEPLSLDSLGELDNGAARAIVNAAINAAIHDLDDRGEDQKPRVVNITLTLSRIDNGMTAMHVEAEAKVPKQKTASTLAVVHSQQGQPRLLFQTLAPNEPHQRTIDEAERPTPSPSTEK